MARKFGGRIVGSPRDFLGVLIFAPIRSSLSLEIWSTLPGDKTYLNFWLLRSKACEFLRVITMSLYMQFLLLC